MHAGAAVGAQAATDAEDGAAGARAGLDIHAAADHSQVVERVYGIRRRRRRAHAVSALSAHLLSGRGALPLPRTPLHMRALEKEGDTD